MTTGESTGGRPPYILEKKDIELAKKMSTAGLGVTHIAKAFDVEPHTIYNLMERDAEFLQSIKKGSIEYFLKCDEMALDGEISPTQYIYFSKTKWKHFYPQEEKIKPEEDSYKNVSQLKVVFTDESGKGIKQITQEADNGNTPVSESDSI